jgi:hypothetical protein
LWIISLMLITTFDHRHIYCMRVSKHTYFSPTTTFKGRPQLHKAAEYHVRKLLHSNHRYLVIWYSVTASCLNSGRSPE